MFERASRCDWLEGDSAVLAVDALVVDTLSVDAEPAAAGLG